MRFKRTALLLCIGSVVTTSGFVPCSLFCDHHVSQSRTRTSLHAAASIVDGPTVDATTASVNDDASTQNQNTLYFDTSNAMTRQRLEERTKELLKEEVGTIPLDILEKESMLILNAWAKTATPTGAQTAQDVLYRLEQEAEQQSQFQLEQQHYAVVIDAWAKSDHVQSGFYADSLLQRMESVLDAVPNRIALNAAMHAWDRQGNVGRVEEILTLLKKRGDVESGDYIALLSAYAKRGFAIKAESLLDSMITTANIRPNIIAYNCILDAWSKSCDGVADAPERAERLLKQLQQQQPQNEEMTTSMIKIRPNAKSFASVAAAWAKSGRDDAVERTKEWIAYAEECDGIDDTYPYNAILDAWAASSDVKNAPKHAESLLNEMGKKGSVNTVSCNIVIKAWARQKNQMAAEKAEAILKRMEHLSSRPTTTSDTLDVRPDVFTYTEVISCYASAANADENGISNGQKAVELLERMVESCRSGNDLAKPNTVTLNCVLDALAKSGQDGAADRALQLLNQYGRGDGDDPCLDKIQLNTISYTTVIDAYARSKNEPNAAKKAEQVFEQMMEDYTTNNNLAAKPSAQSYNAVINAWVQQKSGCAEAEEFLSRMERDGVQPNVISYSILLNGWAKSKSPEAIERTQRIFDKMVQSYRDGNEEARPNLISYVSLLNSMCRRPATPETAKLADETLRHLLEDFEGGNMDVKPNVKLITLVIDTWGKSGARQAGEKAEELLDWMTKAYYKYGKDRSLRPSPLTFTAAINAWAKARVFGKAVRARALLEKMLKLYGDEGKDESLRPNIYAYTAVLNACAYSFGESSEKTKAFQVASETFKHLVAHPEFGAPNHVLYGMFFTAIRNLIPEDHPVRAKSAGTIFKKCCADGQLSDLVIQRIKSTITADQLRELLDGEDGCVDAEDFSVNFESFPEEWRCNVKDRRRRR